MTFPETLALHSVTWLGVIVGVMLYNLANRQRR
jgi:hypothetical protein